MATSFFSGCKFRPLVLFTLLLFSLNLTQAKFIGYEIYGSGDEPAGAAAVETTTTIFSADSQDEQVTQVADEQEQADPDVTTSPSASVQLKTENQDGPPTFQLFGDLENPLLPVDKLNLQLSLNQRTENNSSSTSSASIADAILNSSSNSSVLSTPIFGTKLSCSCGKTQEYRRKPGSPSTPDDEKIVNGEAAYIRDLPWTVGLIRKSTTGFGGTSFPFCGGTLINNLYVLTASHCVDGQSASGIQVLVNEQDLLTSSEAKTMKVDVAEIIMHEGYNKQTIDNDIALIRLSQRMDISSANVITRPACISASSNDFAGVTATVAGFGATSQGSSTSNILRKVDVPILSNAECNSKTNYNGKITENMMCAGFLEGGKDSCQGDSGGPLIALYGGRKTLIGVVSWGYGCAQPLSPGVYTRVSRFSSWILEKTRGGEWCEG